MILFCIHHERGGVINEAIGTFPLYSSVMIRLGEGGQGAHSLSIQQSWRPYAVNAVEGEYSRLGTDLPVR